MSPDGAAREAEHGNAGRIRAVERLASELGGRVDALDATVADLTRALLHVLGSGAEEGEEGDGPAFVFGGDPFPLQRLVPTYAEPDIEGNHLVGIAHQVRIDGRWRTAARDGFALLHHVDAPGPDGYIPDGAAQAVELPADREEEA